MRIMRLRPWFAMVLGVLASAIIVGGLIGFNRISVVAESDSGRVPVDEARRLEREAGFPVAVAMEPGKYRVVEMSVGGPELAPRVLTVYVHEDGSLSMIHLLQSGSGFGQTAPLNLSMGTQEIQMEELVGRYERGQTASGDELGLISWENMGIHYQLGATNVPEEELLAFARSVRVAGE